MSWGSCSVSIVVSLSGSLLFDFLLPRALTVIVAQVSVAFEDLGLTVERQAIVVLRDRCMADEVWTRPSLFTAWAIRYMQNHQTLQRPGANRMMAARAAHKTTLLRTHIDCCSRKDLEIKISTKKVFLKIISLPILSR